jgi:hypothetical protein
MSHTSSTNEVHSVPAPKRQLHVVLHGLICVRMSSKARTVELHFPSVNASTMNDMTMPGHLYRVGTFSDPRRLPTGNNFCLGGVQLGDFNPCLNPGDSDNFKDNFVAFCMSDEGVNSDFQPSGTHALVKLPWPKHVHRLRLDEAAPEPLFTYGGGAYMVDPESFGYISYLTYDLEWDRPVLYQGCEVFWFSEALNRSTRLHFFADPPSGIPGNIFAVHMKAAYGAFNRQLFSPEFDLTPNLNARPTYRPASSNDPIPAGEQTDLPAPTDSPTDEKLLGGPLVGNCLAVYVLD